MRFLTVVSLILIIAKVFSLISLSWIMCLMPFFIVIAIKAVTILLAIVLMIIGYCIGKEK